MGQLLGFIKNPKDFFAGLLFIAVAAVFAYGVQELPIGTAFRMGPGYYPLMLAIILAVLGLAIMINGLRVRGEPIGSVPWRGFVLITGAIVFFGVTLKGLGLVPSLTLTVFGTTLASQHFKLRVALLNTAVLGVAAWLIFVRGLGLPLQLFGPWVGGY